MKIANGALSGWLKLLGMIVALLLSVLTLFFTMVKPAVRDAVAEQVGVEVVQRTGAVQKSYDWNTEEHKQIENRLEKRLDRMETKIDHLLERK